MDEVGEFFGTLVALGYGLALMNSPVRWLNKRHFSHLDSNSPARQRFLTLMKFVVPNHRLFAAGATIALLIHLVLQAQFAWVSWTGVAAATLLVANAGLGAYGYYVGKGKLAGWLAVHRFAAFLLVVAIVVHVSLPV